MDELKTLKISDYVMNFVVNDVPVDNRPSNPNCLTLNEFLEIKTKDLKDNQLVEVFNMSSIIFD